MVKDYPEVIRLIANFTITSLQVRMYTEVFCFLQLLKDRVSVLVLCIGVALFFFFFFEDLVKLAFT